MDHVEKFLRRADRSSRKRFQAVLLRLRLNQWDGLDIAPLKGRKGFFRCRIGGVRIIVFRSLPESIVVDMDFRGNVYKK